MPTFIQDKLIEEFRNKEAFSREELYRFFKQFEPDLKEGTLGWRIHDLKNKNLIRSVRRGYYTLSCLPEYIPEVSEEIVRLARFITTHFEMVKYCIWETAWLNEFTQLQSSRNMILIEIEKDFIESLYYNLKDQFKFDLFLNPDEKAINYYVSESQMPVVIRKLITRSPLAERTSNKIKSYTPVLEKILVDIFAEEKLFYLYQGSGMLNIYENAIKHYALNFTTLFGYAKRREKDQDIKKFMTNYMYHLVKDFIE